MGTTDYRVGLVPKHLDSRNLGTEIDSLNFTMEWQDEPSFARRTVTVMMDRHRLRNPDWAGFLLKVFKGCFGLFLLMIIKLVV